MTTLATFAEQWTSGALVKRYPGRVRVRVAASSDAGILRKHVLPIVGGVPVSAFTLDDAERVVDALPLTLAASTRRRVLGLLVRLLDLAVWPARLLTVNPIPRRGFLPPGERRTYTYLRPDEDAQLMAHTDVGLTRRILWGLLAREGMRLSEALALTWADLDLVHGIVTLRQHKTVRATGARSWALDGGTWRTLVWLRKGRAGELETTRVFDSIQAASASRHLRLTLTRAGILRRELHERTDGSRPLRVHDLRGSFVTIARANDKSDGWIMDRTGHTSATMLGKYARPAREAADRNFGWWGDLDKLLPEVSGSSGRETGETTRAISTPIRAFPPGTPWPHEPDSVTGLGGDLTEAARLVAGGVWS